MQPILLHERGVQRHRLEQERHERQVVLLGADPAYICREFGRVARAVVGRHAHADEQHARAGALARAAPFSADCPCAVLSGRPRRPSFAPSSRITMLRLMHLQGARQALQAAAGGLAADAGVDDLVSVPLCPQPLRAAAQPNPAPAEGRRRHSDCRRTRGSFDRTPQRPGAR